ncbi:MAG: RecB family exonuclease [Kiritimatiellia bacterium]
MRGDALHRILELFVRPRLGMAIKGKREPLALQLHNIAVKELDALDKRGGAAGPLVDVVRDDWLAGLIDERPTGVLGAWLDDELKNSFRWTAFEVETKYQLPLGQVTLKAQLDRVDQTSRRGLIVVDYKSGQAPRTAHVLRGLVLQPVAYAAIAARENPGWGVATAYVELRSPESVKRKGWVGEPEVLASINQKRSVIEMDHQARQELLDHASDAAALMVRGTFHTTLAEPAEAGCRYCDYRRICRWTSGRASELLRSDAILHRPIASDEQEPA